MNFFQQLHEASAGLALTLRIMSKNDTLTIQVIPDSIEDIQPLLLSATAEELDNVFFDTIRRPLSLVAGLQTNAAEFEAAVTKGLDKAEGKEGGKAAESGTAKETESATAEKQSTTAKGGKGKGGKGKVNPQTELTPADNVGAIDAAKNEVVAPTSDFVNVKYSLENATDSNQLRSIKEMHDEYINASETLTGIYHKMVDQLASLDIEVAAQPTPEATPSQEQPSNTQAPEEEDEDDLIIPESASLPQQPSGNFLD